MARAASLWFAKHITFAMVHACDIAAPGAS